jgi:RNA polymerase sigma-70 factor, ECF subfamily
MAEEPPRITGLLQEWRDGRAEAGNRVLELVYAELRSMAARQMRREHGGNTLQTTALVHEAYLRMCG